MFTIKGEKVFSTATYTAETEQDAINMAWTMFIERWFPKVTVIDPNGNVIYRQA